MSSPFEQVRRMRPVRRAAQVAVVVLLLIATALFTHSADKARAKVADEKTVVKITGAILARTCAQSSQASLQKQGLAAECRAAIAGDIGKKVTATQVSDAKSKDPDEVNPDILPDTKGAPPAPDGKVDTAVASYFATHDLSLTPGYSRALRAAVTQVLTRNPGLRGKKGKPGRPPTPSEVGAAVTAALLANPPADGINGVDGRGITNTALDGCDIVFTFTDGTSKRLGSVCGPKGDGPSNEQLADATAAYCGEGDRCKGYPIAFTLADGQTCSDADGDHRYTCEFAAEPADPDPTDGGGLLP